MSATLIAFKPQPARRPRFANDPVAIADLARHFLAEQRIRETLASAEPAKPAAEDEILKLLRRIDRRLAKIAAA